MPLIEATSGPWTARLGGYAVVVAARLHAAVVSLHLATPTVAIAYERKVAGVMEHLGLGAFVWTPGMPARTLGAMVERALADDAPFIAARDQLSREAGEVEGFLRRSLAAVPS